MPALSSRRRTKPKVRKNSGVILASVGTVLVVVCLLFRRAVVLCFWDVVLRCPCGVPVSLPGFCLCFLWLVVRRGCRWLVFYGFPTRRWNRLFAMVSWLLAWCRVAWWRVVVYVCLLLLSTAALLREDGAACWCGGGLRTQERICTTSFTSQNDCQSIVRFPRGVAGRP